MPAKKKAPEKLDCVPKVRSQRKQAKRNEVKARRRKLRIVPRAPVSTKDAGTETLPLEQITLSFSQPSNLAREPLSLNVQLVALQEDKRPVLKTHVLDRGAFVCLCCFGEFKEHMHLIGHYLVHTGDELGKIGVDQREVLQYINQQYPRLKEEKPSYEDFAWGKHPIGKLLVRNYEQNDGFSGYLLRTLPELSAKEYAFDGACYFGGVSEPNHWLLYLDKFQGVPNEREYKWVPTYAETDLDQQYEYDFQKPIALIADGTFMYREEPDERVAYETGAMLALVAGGVWKRHAVEHGENNRKQLAYVGWNTVKQQLYDDGRGELAELFDAFFRDGRYKEKLDKLLEKIGERDWGFADEWVELK